jgi:hypothetical protein
MPNVNVKVEVIRGYDTILVSDAHTTSDQTPISISRSAFVQRNWPSKNVK